MDLPSVVEYPFVVVTDVHGQKQFLERLLIRLRGLPEWSRWAVVFGGDYVDRGPDVRGAVDLILDLAHSHPAPVTGVAGNHDLALVRAARLDDGPACGPWVRGYRERYDFESTFQSYLGRRPRLRDWEAELAALRDAVPPTHREFLGALPWVVEASGHLVLHCGLSPDLEQDAEGQLAALRERRWDDSLTPRPGTKTAEHWQTHYPVWLGADKRLSDAPLPAPGRVQVTGHKPVPVPDVNAVRVRLDTSGGHREPLTACLLRGPDDAPVFVRSDGR